MSTCPGKRASLRIQGGRGVAPDSHSYFAIVSHTCNTYSGKRL